MSDNNYRHYVLISITTLIVWKVITLKFLIEFLFASGALPCLNSPLTTRLVTSAGTCTDDVVEPNVFRTRSMYASTTRPRDIWPSVTASAALGRG